MDQTSRKTPNLYYILFGDRVSSLSCLSLDQNFDGKYAFSDKVETLDSQTRKPSNLHRVDCTCARCL